MPNLNQKTTGLIPASTWTKFGFTPPKPNPPNQNISVKCSQKPIPKKIPSKKISPGKYKKKPDVKPELKEIFDRIKAKKETRIKLQGQKIKDRPEEENKKIIQKENSVQDENFLKTYDDEKPSQEGTSQVRQKINLFEERKRKLFGSSSRKLENSVEKIRSKKTTMKAKIMKNPIESPMKAQDKSFGSPSSGRKLKTKNYRKLEGKLKLASKFNPVGKSILENEKIVVQKSVRDFWASKEMKDEN